jgi:retron-type reverse transcriptase
MRRVSAKVSDPRVLRLIWRYLRAGMVENGQWSPTDKGVPQSGPLVGRCAIGRWPSSIEF